MHPDLKTFREWTAEGRTIIKGQKAEQYVTNDDGTSARALFRRDQTQESSEPDLNQTENWTRIIDASQWELEKAEIREANRRPTVKIREAEGGGTEVWCGPNPTIIDWLKGAGYRFNPKSHYWRHPNKDPRQIAEVFAATEVDGKRIKVNRAFAPVAVPEGI